MRSHYLILSGKPHELAHQEISWSLFSHIDPKSRIWIGDRYRPLADDPILYLINSYYSAHLQLLNPNVIHIIREMDLSFIRSLYIIETQDLRPFTLLQPESLILALEISELKHNRSLTHSRSACAISPTTSGSLARIGGECLLLLAPTYMYQYPPASADDYYDRFYNNPQQTKTARHINRERVLKSPDYLIYTLIYITDSEESLQGTCLHLYIFSYISPLPETRRSVSSLTWETRNRESAYLLPVSITEDHHILPTMWK